MPPTKDFISSNVAGYKTCVFTRFWTFSQVSFMVPEQICEITDSISHLWNTSPSVSERVVRTLVKLCVVNKYI